MRQLQNIMVCELVSSASVLAKKNIVARPMDEHRTKETTLSRQKFHRLGMLTKNRKKK